MVDADPVAKIFLQTVDNLFSESYLRQQIKNLFAFVKRLLNQLDINLSLARRRYTVKKHRLGIGEATMYLIECNLLFLSQLDSRDIRQSIEALETADTFFKRFKNTFIDKRLQYGAVGIRFCEQI